MAHIYKSFYSRLYSIPEADGQHQDCGVRLLHWILVKIYRDTHNVLEAPITKEELMGAVHALAKGKNLGPNGLTIDYFKVY